MNVALDVLEACRLDTRSIGRRVGRAAAVRPSRFATDTPVAVLIAGPIREHVRQTVVAETGTASP